MALQDTLTSVGDAAGLSGGNSLLEIIGNIISIFLGLLGVIFLVLVIYAGFLWMTSQGNEEKVKTAKNILKNATIGLVITLAAYGIVSFILGLILSATGLGGSSSTEGSGIETFSDALGSGAIEDHYPPRNGTDIPRNTKIIVTFKDEMYIPSFIDGYDTAGTATDVSDDTVPTTANLNTGNVTIYCEDEEGTKDVLDSSEVTVTFTEDLQSFVFDPPVLGSAEYEAICGVELSADILDADGAEVFTGSSSDGYKWTFTLSTEIDSTPPRVKSVVPEDGSEYARNITVQITFNEAMDPTAVTGTYDADEGGFTHLQVRADEDEDGTYSLISGTFEISSGYTIVEFTSADACGTNSCNETIYCLPGPDTTAGELTEEIQLEVSAATLGDAPPEAETPADGAVDVAGNSLDGDADGTAEGPRAGADDADYDDYEIGFEVTDEIVLTPPTIVSVSPSVLGEDVALDQDVVILWDTFMKASTMTNNYVSLYADPDHEMYYVDGVTSVDQAGDEPASGASATQSELTISHGTFLDSTDDDLTTAEDESSSQLYAPLLPDDIESLYQNCFYPAEGPGETTGETCSGDSTSPYCCNGQTSTEGFDETSFSCQP